MPPLQPREPEGHPFVVMLAGAFLGGVVAGANNATSLWGMALPIVLGALALPRLFGHKDMDLPLIAALLGAVGPCGLLGVSVGKSLWG